MTPKGKAKRSTKRKESKRDSKVYHSVKEFNQKFLPVSYRQERLKEKGKDSENLGASLAQEHLEEIRRELQRQY